MGQQEKGAAPCGSTGDTVVLAFCVTGEGAAPFCACAMVFAGLARVGKGVLDRVVRLNSSNELVQYICEIFLESPRPARLRFVPPTKHIDDGIFRTI